MRVLKCSTRLMMISALVVAGCVHGESSSGRATAGAIGTGIHVGLCLRAFALAKVPFPDQLEALLKTPFHADACSEVDRWIPVPSKYSSFDWRYRTAREGRSFELRAEPTDPELAGCILELDETFVLRRTCEGVLWFKPHVERISLSTGVPVWEKE